MLDKNSVRNSFLASANTYEQHAIAQKESARYLFQAIDQFCENAGVCLEIGCGTGILTREIVKNIKPQLYYLNDLSVELCDISAGLCNRGTKSKLIVGDAESADLPLGVDLIVSSATMQWFSDLGGFVAKLQPILSEQGLLAFAIYSSGTMSELTSITGDGLVYFSKDEIENMVSDNFEIVFSQELKRTLYFQSFIDILRHIRHTGVGAINPVKKYDRKTINSLANSYKEKFQTPSGLPVTYNTTIVLARHKRVS